VTHVYPELLDPDGNLSERVPWRAILSANQHVAKVENAFI